LVNEENVEAEVDKGQGKQTRYDCAEVRGVTKCNTTAHDITLPCMATKNIN